AQRHACSKCHRVNNKDARYCDWCGSKASQPPSRVQCGGCGGSSQPYASYCCTCGLVLVAPPPCCSRPAGGASHPQELLHHSHAAPPSWAHLLQQQAVLQSKPSATSKSP
ncbi:hypothetical protein CRUP_010003, partial [Coryphaenoides rupestris]